MKKELPKDSTGATIQGFAPIKVIPGATTAIDISQYAAFRVSGDVNMTYTIDGIVSEVVSLSKGSITVCTNITSITCTSAVNIEVM